MIISGDIHLGFFSALTLYIYRIAAHREIITAGIVKIIGNNYGWF